MASAYSGPIATRLVALSDLHKLPAYTKVRFLGCVTRYKLSTAELTIEHDYPRGNVNKATVDVRLLLSTLSSQETRVGEWVNVMGYVQSAAPGSVIGAPTVVQALVLWSAGAIRIAEYEETLQSIGGGD